MKRVRTCVVLLLLLAVSSGAWAASPTKDLRALVGRVLVTFNDPATRGLEHRAQRHAAISKAMDMAIDFSEVSRRALGATWATRTPGERREFVAAFRDFLKYVYLGQLDRYDDQKIVYDSERIDGHFATVTTRIEAKDGATTPFLFNLIQRDGRWRIYDIVIDGGSLTETYRAQFTAVLRRESFASLVAHLKARRQKAAASVRAVE